MCSLPPCDKGEEYNAYTLGMDQPPSAGRIWAPDDKARTMAWDVSEQDYLMAGLEQMARDTTHWKMMPGQPGVCLLLNSTKGCTALLDGRSAFTSAGRKDGQGRSCRKPTARSNQSAMISLRCGADVPVKNLATAACGKSSAGGIIQRVLSSELLAVRRLRGLSACECHGNAPA